MPPQINVALIEVRGKGTLDDWDRAGDGGIVKFTGSIAGYYSERVQRLATAGAGGGVDVITTRTLYVNTTDYTLSRLDTDDTITLRRLRDEQTMTARAGEIAVCELDGIPVGLATTRIELELDP